MSLKTWCACDILLASSLTTVVQDVMSNISEASQAAAPAMTFRWTELLRSTFSFPVMCMVLLSTVIFEICVKQFAEPDIWWHLRDAQNLIEYHSFSRIDTYSFTAAGLSRPNFEWLSEVPYYLAFKTWGLQGLLLVSIVVSVLIFAGVYYLCCRSGADCKDAVIVTLLAIFLGTVSIGPRMLLLGWLCMVALLLLLDQYRRTGQRFVVNTAIVPSLDQPARILGLWNSSPGNFCSFRTRGRRMGAGCGPPMEPLAIAKSSARRRGFFRSAFCESLRLQVGVVSLRGRTSAADRSAARRRMATA